MITAITMWLWSNIFKEEKMLVVLVKEILSMFFLFSFVCAVILDIRILLAVK